MTEKKEDRQWIKIRGANEHNLKNIDIDIPRNELVVLTGLSGSGKSSLAFDTIYAEGQRRYMESLSSYARQFLGQMEKPDVESIEGLPPAISIDQKDNKPQSQVDSWNCDGNLRLLSAFVCESWNCPLSKVRQRDQQTDCGSDGRSGYETAAEDENSVACPDRQRTKRRAC